MQVRKRRKNAGFIDKNTNSLAINARPPRLLYVFRGYSPFGRVAVNFFIYMLPPLNLNNQLMKKHVVYFLCLISISASAQEKVKQHKIKAADRSTGAFYFTDLEYSDDESVKVYGRLWRMGTLSVTKDGKKTDHGSGNTMVPSLVAITAASSGTTSIAQDYINLQSIEWANMKGYEYKAADPTSNEVFASSQDKSFDEVLLKYPKAYRSAKEETESFYNYSLEIAAFGGTRILESVTKYKFDRVRNKLVAEKPEQNWITPKMPEIDGKYLYEGFYFKDNKRKMVSCVAGVAKKGESKFYSSQNRKIVTVASNGDLINSIDLQYTYPRSLIFASALGMSATDTLSTFEEGGIFIFGKMFGGGKNNDPDPTNYDFVVVGPQGELVSKGSFKFGLEKKTLEPVYAYKKENKIYVLAKGVGKESPGYATLIFDNTGLTKTNEYATAQLKTMTVGPYDKGLTANYGRLLQVTNHFNLPDGGVLLCGEAYEDVTPLGASFTDPKVREYYSQVFLYIDKDGNLVKNIVLEKTEPESRKGYTKQTLLQQKNGKFVFTSSEGSGAGLYPILTVIDATAWTAKKTSLKRDDIYNVDGDIIYQNFPEKSKVVFLGRNLDKDSYTMNCSIYKVD